MRRIGLLGGMSWESSIEYERLLNEGVWERLGGVASADLIVRSYNFAEIERLQAAGEWDTAGAMLAADARLLQDAGAELILLCTNTMHRVADAIEAALDVPFLHLADATADAVHAAGLDAVGLLGTRYTMEGDFYRGRLTARGLSVLVPDEPDRTTVHQVIYDELVQGRIETASKAHYLAAIDRLIERGAQGIIAGCTEIELLITGEDVPVPFFPTTRLHVQRALELALA
ncbi:aspartate/glutamate racemase family protein [Ruania halotolerans]|uniref:aspartate/glutamate racemase family protein n=1 Tax=Ruania halotolerans TaxID=2897773 RepID=UPI001E3D7125|nr:aspartate/glutamate racemase family protein [Ruania halotolerans]UFU08007.1 aspartate/glutamate racemase family protein [Ruania halotolerans]